MTVRKTAHSVAGFLAPILMIITLFESQIILEEHECCTNWGDCKSNKSNQIKCWFLRRGKNRSSRRKTSRSRVENQQTQPTNDAGSENRTRDTLVEGERSHLCASPAHAQSTRHDLKPNIFRPALLLDQVIHNRESFDLLVPKNVIK